MGEDTQEIVSKLDDVIRATAQQVNALAIGHARMEEKQCAMHNDVLETKLNVKTINGRVGRLENWRAYLAGVMAVVLVVVGIIVKYKL